MPYEGYQHCGKQVCYMRVGNGHVNTGAAVVTICASGNCYIWSALSACTVARCDRQAVLADRQCVMHRPND